MPDTNQNQLNLGSSWPETKEKIKEADPRLNDEVLDYQPGKEKALYDRLRPFLNRDDEHIRRWIESISQNTAKAG